MNCKKCGMLIKDKDIFCTNCGVKIGTENNLDNEKIVNNNDSIDKNKKTINTICKILLIINFILIIAGLLEADNFIIYPSIILIAATIGILKTEQKRNNIFLILGAIAMCLSIVLPIIIIFAGVSIVLFLKIFGAFEGVSFLDVISKMLQSIFNVKGGILCEVILIIIGISFILIHKNQKFKNHK